MLVFNATTRAALFFGYTGGDRIPQLLRKIPRDFRDAGDYPRQNVATAWLSSLRDVVIFHSMRIDNKPENLAGAMGYNPTVDYGETPPAETTGFSNERFRPPCLISTTKTGEESKR